MKLYHGSTVTVKSPNIQKGRKATDFGKGFYTTTNFEQAKKWAILKRNREHGKKAVVSVYEVPDNILDREFSVLRFEGATKEWLEFVVNNRRGKGKNSYEQIDCSGFHRKHKQTVSDFSGTKTQIHHTQRQNRQSCKHWESVNQCQIHQTTATVATF